MGWERAIITDSGGFQVFSLAHGNVADEIKGRRGRPGSHGSVLEISERGRRASAPTSTAASGSWARRSRCRCRRRWAPTSPWSSTSARPTTPTASTRRARPSAPTAGSTAASTGTRRTRPAGPGGVRDRPGRRPRGPAPRVCRVRLRGRRRRARDRRHPGPRQGRDARRARDDACRCCRPMRRSTCSGSASPTTCCTGSGCGIDVFDCAVPTRLARHGMALAPLPDSRFRFDVGSAVACARRRGPARRGLPVSRLRRPHPRLPALPARAPRS